MDNFPIQDVSLRAILEAAREELAAIDRTVLLVTDIDNVDASALPWLGHEYSVMGYKGWLLTDDDDERRELIKQSYEIHTRMGTVRGIVKAVELVGYTAVVEPWYLYDGQPYHIRIEILDVSRKGLTEERYEWILRMVDQWKAVRTIVDGIRFIEGNAEGHVYAGTIAQVGVTTWALPADA